ncbi:MAG TPA: PadR family transcriptional regulator [Candidatus Binataceae bacterium]|nr:PadR family transcriptional regulator [Candidatus Binataceae bacterium]
MKTHPNRAKPRATTVRKPPADKESFSRWVATPEVGWPKKPPRIDIKFPILGFLMESEMTGYDLKRRFHDPIGFFYRASDGSLYPALKKLAHDAMVVMRAERHGLRARKVYAITPKGREHFLRTLRDPAQPIFVYDEAQVKIYFAHHDPETALHHIERERRFAGAWGSFLERLLRDMRSQGASPFRTSMVEIGHGIAALKADLFDKLMVRLTRDLRVASHTGNGARSGRRLDENHGRRRASGSTKATHGTTP